MVGASAQLNAARSFIVIMGITVTMAVAMTMAVIMPTGQQPGARDVDRKPNDSDRDGLTEVDRKRVQEAIDGLIADQDGDHREHDSAAVACQIAELARAESETTVIGITAGKRVGQSSQKQGAGMRRHMQSIGDQGERAEHGAADDFDNHHGAAKDDNRPGPAFGALMIGAQKDMIVRRELKQGTGFRHEMPHFK